MGAVSFSLDRKLVEAARSALPLTTLVETGTFEGDTVAHFLGDFDEIISIELSDALFAQVSARFAGQSKVRLLHGGSETMLAAVAGELSAKAALYWLDAHWCVSTGTAGELSQCPLLREIEAIGPLNDRSIIVIDDARLFLSPPGPPHEISQWPQLWQILERLTAASASHRYVVVNDTIVFYPPDAAAAIMRYGREHGFDWLLAANQFRNEGNIHDQLVEKETLIHTLDGELKRQIPVSLVGHDVAQVQAQISAIGQEVAQMLARTKRIADDVGQARIEMAQAAAQGRATLATLQAAIKQLAATQHEQGQQLASALYEHRDFTARALPLLRAGRMLHLATRPVAFPLHAWNYMRFRVVGPFFTGWRNVFEHVTRPRLWSFFHHPPRRIQLPPDYIRPAKLTRPPKISIVTPSYQHGHYIERTIRSVLDQNYPNLQYFVQDGGSKDATVDVLKRHESRLAGWVSEKDGGQANGINRGFARADGEIMGWLNSDDLLLPGSLAYVARFFQARRDVDVIYGHRVMINEEDKEIGRWVLPEHDDAMLSWADYVPQETMFWRRSAWEKIGGKIDESFRFAMDWDLLVRFREAGAKIVRAPRFMGAFRIHPEQKTSAMNMVGWEEMTRIRKRIHGREPSVEDINQALANYISRQVREDIFYRINRRLRSKAVTGHIFVVDEGGKLQAS